MTDAFPRVGRSADPDGKARTRFRGGSAPDSWGVWFARDPRQTPWTRFLDEIARAGYDWLELGPYGYLPTDAGSLRSELEARGLRLAGGTAGGPLHRRAELPAIRARVLGVARLAGARGAPRTEFVAAVYPGLAHSRPAPPAQPLRGPNRPRAPGA